jgi:hypothetical protein
MRLYSDLASWWPLLSPPSHYVEEAEYILPRLPRQPGEKPTLLELGAGGGSLAWHLKGDFRLTLTDLSPEMQAVSAAVNPGVEHLLGDMRTIRLGRQFDVVLIHDAICYMITPDDLRAALATAGYHCRPGGTLMVLPDHVTETFAPEHSSGGEDGADGRGLRYLDWTYDPDPSDCHYEVVFALLLREADGSVTVEMDRHRDGLFPRDQWIEWIGEAGFTTTFEVDPWDRHVFVATKV